MKPVKTHSNVQNAANNIEPIIYFNFYLNINNNFCI